MATDQSDILDAMPVMAFTALPDGTIDFVNRRWADYTGLDPQDRDPWQAAVDPCGLPHLLQAWQAIKTTGKAGEMEARLRRFDGQYRAFQLQLNPVRDTAGEIVQWYGVATDIEDRRHAEGALERRALDLQLIIDSISVPLAVTTPTGEVESLNQPTLDYFGMTLETLKDWKASDVVHPDDLERTIAAQMEAHQTGAAYNVESRHRRADGVYRWYNVLGMPLRDPQGDIRCWLHLLIDIEERKRAEEALAASERDLRLMLDSIPVRVSIYDAEGTRRAANRRAIEVSGLSGDADWRALYHPDEIPAAERQWRRCLEREEPYEREYRAHMADGSYRWHLARRVPVRDENGKILRWYGVSHDIEELKRAERALQESERNLQLTIDTIPALAWSARTDGTAAFLSKHYLDYVGMTAEEARDWGWAAAVHPDDMAGLTAIWQSALASGMATETEARLRRFDGRYRWFLFRVNPLRDDNGTIIKWYGINTDIEDRKHSDEVFRTIVETTPECVKLIGRDGTVLRVNSAGAEMAGVPAAAQVVGLNFFDFVAPEHREKYHAFHDWICGGGKGALEFDLINARGIRRRMETHAAPLHRADGTVVQLGVTRDITERKRSEDQLRRNEAFLAEGQHLARMGNLSWNSVTGDIVWSEQLYRIFEFEPGTPVTFARIASRIHPEDLPQLPDFAEEARRGQSDFECQLRIILPDGSIKHLHLIAHRAGNRQDDAEYIGAVLDITQRRLSEEALETLRSEFSHISRFVSLGTLTASIAHEVNQPLAGIVTNAGTCLRMLAADPPNIEGAQETARRTIRDGKRAADVIARLRALFTNRAVTIEPVDLNDAVREVIALSAGELQRNRIMLRTELAGDRPMVAGDRIQLQQVIMNLLRNAVDAMTSVDGRPRSLSVETSGDAEERVRLSVRDAGTGIDPEVRGKLFETFTTTKSDGMGIGLSISRSIIERHNGRLWAEANEGPGATFSFAIPRAASVAEIARNTAEYS